MSPTPGSIHRQPRSDSGAARLWAWARSRRVPWTCPEAAEAADLSPRRTRAIVRVLHLAGMVDMIRAADQTVFPPEAATWALTEYGRQLPGPPVLIRDGEGMGAYIGARPPGDGRGNAKLIRILDRAGVSGTAAAKALGIHARTLRRMRSGDLPIAADDPIIEAAASLRP